MNFFLTLLFLLVGSMAFGQQYYSDVGDKHWQSPVPSAAALPVAGNNIGDLRVETTAFALYVWNGAAWLLEAGGGGGGTVTSVGLALTGPLFTVSGSPVVGAGTLTGTINTQANNTVFAGPNGGGPLAPTFRSLVAADIPALPYMSNALTSTHLFVGNAGNVATDVAASGDLTLANTGAFTIANLAVTNAKIANATIDLTAKVTGVLPIANGGTNASTVLNNNRVIESLGGSLVEAAAITSNRALISDGAGLPIASAVTAATLAFLDATSSVQTQLNAKQATLSTSAAPANQFGTGFTAPNTFTYAQPDFTNLSGSATAAQMLALPSANIYVGTAGNVPAAVAMSGGATISNTGVVTLTNASVTGQPLTGFVAGAGVVAATDTILQAFNKVVGNAAGALSKVLVTDHIFVGSAGNVATDVAMSGDASIVASGALTVNSVGTSSAANIHTAELLANAATSANTVSTIVRRDGSGNFSAGNVSASFFAPDGTAGSPSYNFSTDIALDTGMFHPSDGVISFSTNGVVAGTFDASQNLTVTGTITASNFPATGLANHFTGWDGAGLLTSLPDWTFSQVNGATAMSQQGSYVVPVDGTPGTVKINNFETEWNAANTNTDQNLNAMNFDSHVDRSHSGNDVANVAGVSIAATVEGSGTVANHAAMSINHGFSGNAGGTTTSGSSFGISAGTSPAYILNNYVAIGANFFGDPASTVGAITELNLTSAANLTGNYLGTNLVQTGTIGGSYFGSTVAENGAITGNAVSMSSGQTGNVTGSYSGLNIFKDGDAANFSGMNISQTSGNVGSSEGVRIGFTPGTANSKEAFVAIMGDGVTANGGRILDGIWGNGNYNDRIGIQLNGGGGNVTTQDVGINVGQSTGTSGTFQGVNVTGAGGTTGQWTGIGVGGTGASTGNVVGINSDVTNITSPNQKVSIQGSGGALSVGYTYDTTTLTPGFEYQLNQVGGNLQVDAGHPLTGQFGFINNLGANILFNDDIPVDGSGVRIGTSFNGFVGQIGGAPGKTVDALGYMSAGAADLGTDGTIDLHWNYRAFGILPPGAGVPLTVNNEVGFLADVSMDAHTYGTSWAFRSDSANSNNYFKKNVVVGSSTTPTNASVGLELNSTTQAILNSRMTAAQEALLTAVNGMQVYNTTADTLDCYIAGAWGPCSATGSGTVTSVSVVSANGLAGTVATATTTPAITLSTTLTSNVVKANGTAFIASVAGTDYQAPISTSAAVANQFLTAFTAPNTFSRAQPDFTNLSGSATAAQMLALPSGDIYVGTGGNVPAAVAMSGDATIATGGALTIAANAVTNAKAAQMAANTIKGNNTGGAANASDLTVAQVVTMLQTSLNALYCQLAGCTMSGAIDMGSNQIHNVLDPTTNQDAATKLYVDSVAANGVAKAASVYASTAALPANVYNNGAAGVGATLTGVAFGALVVDGNTVTVGQRILVKNEAAPANNGIYTVTTVGAVATLYVLTRATDFNSTTDIVDGATTYITSGATLANETWQLAVAGAVTVGTTALPFNQIAGPGAILAGTGLTLTGSVISLNSPVVIANGGTNSIAALSNNRVMQSSGGAIVEAAAITGNRALVSDASGIPTHSATTDTELGYVSGVTSAIQTQLNAKQATISTSGAVANQFVTGFTAPNTFTRAQPAFTDISGNLDLSSQVTGNLAVSHLNTGTGASNTTFWRGDGTWATPGGGGSTPLNPQVSTTLAAHAVDTWFRGARGNTGLASGNWRAIAYAPQNTAQNSTNTDNEPRFVAIRSSGGNKTAFMNLNQSLSWNVNAAADDSNSWSAIAYSPELGRFVIVSDNAGNTNQVNTSDFGGASWTSRTASSAKSWRGVAWSPELSLFCAVANDGSTATVMTSPDGITWTDRTAASAATWKAVTWSPELLLFVAVADSGASRVMTSPDGITWTSRTASSAQAWDAIVWSPEKTLFVAVQNGLAGTSSGSAMTSPDGVTWTDRTLAGDGTTWKGVAWSPELGLFAANNGDSTNANFVYSSDGITWTGATFFSTTNGYTALTWGAQYGIFMGVANSGIGTDASTSSRIVKKFIAP